MIELLCTAPVFLVSGFLLVRLGLVIIGMHKGPLLSLFEKYGDEENHFAPIPRIIGLLGVCTISGSIFFSQFMQIPVVVAYIGVLCMFIYYLIQFWLPEAFRAITDEFPPLPVWYHQLRERTGREERRRIAYMWLRLPARTRLLYNSNTRAFEHWADLIIIAG